MKLKYLVSYKDFSETGYFIWNRRYRNQAVIANQIFLPIIFGLISSLPVFMFSSQGIWVSFLTFMVVAIICYVFTQSTSKQTFNAQCFKMFGKQADIEIEFELNENGVVNRQFGNEFLSNWKNIEEVVETDERVFFVANEHTNSISVPKRAFDSENSVAACIAFGKARINAPKSIAE